MWLVSLYYRSPAFATWSTLDAKGLGNSVLCIQEEKLEPCDIQRHILAILSFSHLNLPSLGISIICSQDHLVYRHFPNSRHSVCGARLYRCSVEDDGGLMRSLSIKERGKGQCRRSTICAMGLGGQPLGWCKIIFAATSFHGLAASGIPSSFCSLLMEKLLSFTALLSLPLLFPLVPPEYSRFLYPCSHKHLLIGVSILHPISLSV